MERSRKSREVLESCQGVISSFHVEESMIGLIF